MISHKQLSLAEIFEDCQDKLDNDKYSFLALLDEIVPVSFVSHFQLFQNLFRNYLFIFFK